MTPDRLNSSGQVVLASEKLVNNLRSGNSYTRTFTGSPALIQSQRLIELAFGATQVEAESTADGNYRLSATYPWDVTHGSSAEPPVNVHELEVAMESVDVFASDVMLAQLVAVMGSVAAANNLKAYIKAAVTNWKQNETSATYAKYLANVAKAEAIFSNSPTGTPPGLGLSGSQLSTALNIFRGVAFHGVEQAPQFKTTYSRRITAATPAQIVAAETGVGQIFTAAEVTALEGVPSVGFFTLNTAYLWFKAGPRVKTTAGQKTEVAYEYISTLFAWSGTVTAYGAAPLATF
jgi:hypothetical protein